MLSDPVGISNRLSASTQNVNEQTHDLRGLKSPVGIFGTLPKKKEMHGSTSTLNELKNKFIRAPSEIRNTKSTHAFVGDIQSQMEDFKSKYEVTGVIGRGGGGKFFLSQLMKS